MFFVAGTLHGWLLSTVAAAPGQRRAESGPGVASRWLSNLGGAGPPLLWTPTSPPPWLPGHSCLATWQAG